MRYRVVYAHKSDGDGEVTRHLGLPLTHDVALELADHMSESGDYDEVVIECQPRPGARWER